MMMGWYGSGMGGGWGVVLMTVSSLLFWGLVIAGVVALIRYAGGSAHRGTTGVHGPTPQQTLADRFGRGEIDEEEYRRRLQVLGAAPSDQRGGG